jgi:hypothetical protein
MTTGFKLVSRFTRKKVMIRQTKGQEYYLEINKAFTYVLDAITLAFSQGKEIEKTKLKMENLMIEVKV